MKRSIVTLLLVSGSMTATAADNQCLAKKYDAYIDASLAWYQDLTQITTETYPDLDDVGQWFLAGRQHHFELNRTAVHYYLNHQSEKVATSQSIESWLKLDQQEIKTLASRDDELGQSAKVTFDDRQSKPHEKNYQLRSAFAELLSHPKQIEPALNRYNEAMAKAERIHCQ
ncbi:hypothetical protein [Vibrio cincinnatiensis]|uniref:hypothetical protein n=1 Tax=Vibrio cincinnatiensis TaxID=675 RepID=UPI001EDF33F2|nr:hypothetical protein [Vibrio cincinnatiensis]MCG3728165.1 hypothetical protein [Vibrio cincinnatiensis]